MKASINAQKERFFNLVLLVLCFFRFVFSGRALKTEVNPKRILVIHAAKLGDMVCATPIFRAIKKQYPGVKLVVSGNSLNGELLDCNKDIDEYYVYHYDFFRFFRYLKDQRFNFACVVAPNFWGLALLYLAGIPAITAPRIKNSFSPTETRSYKILSFLVFRVDYYFGQYIPGQYLKLLKLISIESKDTKKHLSFSKKARYDVGEIFQDYGVLKNKLKIAISPGAGNKVKLWGGEKFAALADYLFDKYDCELFVIGSRGDKDDVLEMRDNLSQAKIHNLSGQLSIDQLKAFIVKMDLFISVDTGPIFIAEAFAVPTVDIVGPVDEREQPPNGGFHRIVKIKNRKPAVNIFNTTSINIKEARQQVEGISVQMVKEKVDELISEIRK